MLKKKIIIGTRGSLLALFQTNIVKRGLECLYSDVEVIIKVIKTTGDIIQNIPLYNIGGKHLFTKEISRAIYNNECDIGVHSMKDVETILPKDMEICCILPRDDIRDVLICPNNYTLDSLPSGFLIGTSSLRRKSQILNKRPDLIVKSIRGNIQTRINKYLNKDFDAIILSLAGLQRLNISDIPMNILPKSYFIPSVGQGAIGIECNVNNKEIKKIIEPLNCKDSFEKVMCERAMLEALNCGCKTPVGGYSEIHEENITLFGYISTENGKISEHVSMTDKRDNYYNLGYKVGVTLHNKMGKYIEHIFGKKK